LGKGRRRERVESGKGGKWKGGNGRKWDKVGKEEKGVKEEWGSMKVDMRVEEL